MSHHFKRQSHDTRPDHVHVLLFSFNHHTRMKTVTGIMFQSLWSMPVMSHWDNWFSTPVSEFTRYQCLFFLVSWLRLQTLSIRPSCVYDCKHVTVWMEPVCARNNNSLLQQVHASSDAPSLLQHCLDHSLAAALSHCFPQAQSHKHLPQPARAANVKGSA